MIVYIVWSAATGPIACYESPNLAHAHAQTMIGVDVASLPVESAVPDIVRDDLTSEYEGDEQTPVIDVGKLDDQDEQEP